MNARLRTALILALLFLAAWLPRVVALDAFVTIDERKVAGTLGQLLPSRQPRRTGQHLPA